MKLKQTKFSLLIDESNSIMCTKYLHILVRFFYENSRKVLTTFYRALPVNKGDADSMIGAIHTALSDDEIPWSNVLQIMSDSPNVMRGRFTGVLSKIKSQYAPHLLDVGGCSLHHVHNAVSYAIDALDEDVEEFTVNIFGFFKHRAGLWEEFQGIQKILEIEEHRILRFVSTRWLSILPVISRLLEQWDALVKFFLDTLPTKHPNVLKQDRTKRIVLYLQDISMHTKMFFLQATLPHFQKLVVLVFVVCLI